MTTEERIDDAGTRPGASPEDLRTVALLRAGDEAAFATLVDMYHASLLRLARSYVSDKAVAEEVVQEAWLGLLQSLERFEGRASLKTWLFRILMNCARTRARKESRSVAFSALGGDADGDDEPALDPARFHGAGGAYPGHWAAKPSAWAGDPEERAVSSETREVIRRAIEGLPVAQRQVVTLRDIEGLAAEEACNLLGLSDTNQRVLLHRARSKVRRALEAYFAEGAA